MSVVNLSEISFFTIFLVVIFIILLLDLGVFTKNNHKIGFSEAAVWSVAWVLLSLLFYFFIIHWGDLIHGIDNLDELNERILKYKHPITIEDLSFEEAIIVYEKNLGLEYLTGYIIEKSLSVDNIFVILMIFYAFGVDEKYYKRVLIWGIIGAVIMRFIFIFAGAALVAEFDWVLYLFGAFLVFTGVNLFIQRHKQDKVETEKHPIVKFVSKYFKVHKSFHGADFFVKKEGKWFITPLFIVLLVIEFSDVIFAVDSIPAIFAVSKDPYIIFFSNIFAILGLRALFFLLISVLNKFYYLKVGLSALLVFIGIKLLAHDILKEIGFTTVYSLYIILAILVVSILVSILFPPSHQIRDKNSYYPNNKGSCS